MKLELVHYFGGRYILDLDHCQLIESAMFGHCLEAPYQWESDPLWRDLGDFRIDQVSEFRVLPEQLEMAEAA